VKGSSNLVVFTVEGRSFALAVESVDQATPMVEVSPLPGAPETVLGIINVRGEIVPVLNLRRVFRLAEREITPFDQLLIARSSRRKIALAVDSVKGISPPDDNALVEAEKILPRPGLSDGVLKLGEEMVLIQNLDRFLSSHEEAELDESLKLHEGD
jgi:purine-binding chemotaxis protein CheW